MNLKTSINCLLSMFILIHAFTYTQQPSSTSEPQIKLLTSDGQEIEVSRDLAFQSSYIKNIAVDLAAHADLDEPISVGPATKAEFQLIVECLKQLNAADQSKIKRQDGAYIAQRIQPTIDGVFRSSTNVTLAGVAEAAEFLDLRYLANGLIRLLVSKLLSEKADTTMVDINNWRANNRVLRDSLTPFIEYQYQLVKNGNIPELNVADYIAIYGIPQIQNKNLDLNGKNITSLEGLNKIKDLATVENLYLKNNKLFSIEKDQLVGLSNMTDLYLENNRLVNIAVGALANLPKLRGFYLSNNNLSTFAPRTFTGLIGLALLNLDNNKLTVIHKNEFAGLSNLKIFRLNNNSMTYIMPGAFSDLPNLLDLYLENNQLRSVEAGTFVGITQLRKIDLRNNPILNATSAAEFRAVQSLASQTAIVGAFTQPDVPVTLVTVQQSSTSTSATSQQGLSVADYIAINGMPVIQNGSLDLSSKGLTSLEGLNQIDGITNLENLNLAGNKLTHLVSGTFVRIANLKKLDLSGNKITKIDSGTFNNPHLHWLNLNNNSMSHPGSDAFTGLTNRLHRLSLKGNNLSQSDQFKQQTKIPVETVVEWPSGGRW